jgi:hypothetical protein
MQLMQEDMHDTYSGKVTKPNYFRRMVDLEGRADGSTKDCGEPPYLKWKPPEDRELRPERSA